MPKHKEELPYNKEIEEAIIGALLIDGELINDLKGVLEPTDFFMDATRYCYEACLSLSKEGKPVNMLTIANELTQKGKLGELLGGVSYLQHLVGQCPTTIGVLEWAKVIKELSLKRQLIQAIFNITANFTDKNFEKMIDEIEAEINKFRLKSIRSRLKPTFQNLTIISSQPKRYALQIEIQGNSQKLELTLPELLSAEVTGKKIMEKFDILPEMPAQKDWKKLIQSLVLKAEKEGVPNEAKEEFLLKLAIQEMFEIKGEGEEISDIKSGCYLKKSLGNNEYYCFMPRPLQKWLKDRGISLKGVDLWLAIKSFGGIKDASVRLGDESRRLWALPVNFAEEKEEEIKKPKEKLEEPEKRFEEFEEFEGEFPKGF